MSPTASASGARHERAQKGKAAMLQETSKIWMDGKFVDWKDANVHILTHTLHYGLGVFEGIRCYKTVDGPAVFRLEEHVARLYASAHISGLKIPFAPEEFSAAILETLRVNGMEAGYIRPLIYVGYGAMGVYPGRNPVRAAIAVWPWGAYLGDEGLEKGIRVKTTSFTRQHVNISMTKAKICGNYTNSILGKVEAIGDGYDEALFLDATGHVAEGSGENIFLVRRGALLTPPRSAILEGITREAVLAIAADLGLPSREELFSRDQLYVADEAFFTGTAAEITPIREVDRRTIGSGARGPLTKRIQDVFFSAVRGENPAYRHWLTKVRS
jgi:branched-chain amino acid aminotransferase